MIRADLLLRRRFALALVFSLGIFGATAARAELHLDLTKPKVEPLPIAIPDFAGNAANEIQLGRDLTQVISADLLPADLGSSAPWGGGGRGDLVISLPLREAREIFERDYLVAQINRFGGNISRTAAFIGMERSALHRKLKSLGVGPDEREQGFNA